MVVQASRMTQADNNFFIEPLYFTKTSIKVVAFDNMMAYLRIHTR